MRNALEFWRFTVASGRVVAQGSAGYYAWLGLLLALILAGAVAYTHQLQEGLIASSMRDPVSWGLYIGSFAFLVGVAAAAVVLVIPAYVYQWGPIREVVLIAEIMAISAIVMSMLFVFVDLGRPERFWHLLPLVGRPHFPQSLLIWDILVLCAYLAVNYFVVTYLVFCAYRGRPYRPGLVYPIVFFSIPLAVGIHTVTAFLFIGLKARPFWSSAVLAPRFLASAFCSGPALLVLAFRVLRHVRPIPISDAALRKIGELVAYALAVNLFLLGCEAFRDLYAVTAESVHARFQWFGIEGHGIALYTWAATAAQLVALGLLVVPSLRQRIGVLTLACGLAVPAVFIEKGLGLVLPGFTPGVLGDVYAYVPSWTEIGVTTGILALGALGFTLMTRVCIDVTLGNLRAP